jgi:hypothetical protein
MWILEISPIFFAEMPKSFISPKGSLNLTAISILPWEYSPISDSHRVYLFFAVVRRE